jgi:hypothetical protein
MANKSRDFFGFKRLLGDESNPTGGIVVDINSKALHIVDPDDVLTDWNVAADSHPSVYVHSATTPATDYLKIYHDASDAYVSAVGANLYLKSDSDVLIDASTVLATTGIISDYRTVTDITTAGAVTYSAAQLKGGIITRDPNGAARTDTTDTAANLVASFPDAVVGSTFTCYLVNTADAAEAITLSGGTGVTVSNAGQTVDQNESALLLFRFTNVTSGSGCDPVYPRGITY